MTVPGQPGIPRAASVDGVAGARAEHAEQAGELGELGAGEARVREDLLVEAGGGALDDRRGRRR